MSALISARGVRSTVVERDLREPGAAGALFEQAERDLGPVSILVNNASSWSQDSFSCRSTDGLGRSMQQVSNESFEANFSIDARAAALLISEFARRHVHSGGSWGRIVGLSSGGESGFESEVSYGAAKAALGNYTMSAGLELARYGVTANIVYPPITDTGSVTEEVRRFALEQGGHVAEPSEVAEVVGWLCGDSAQLVTGNRIRLR